MNESAIHVETELIEEAVAALIDLPNAHMQVNPLKVRVHGTKSYDAAFSVTADGNEFVLLIEAKHSVFPRDARELVWRSDTYKNANELGVFGKPRVLLIVAESFSPGAKQILSEQGVGYFDSGGSLFLSAPGAYIYIDKPAPKPAAKALKSLFTGRRAQVIHALLRRHHTWLNAKELAEGSQASAATVSQVLVELERFDWVDTRGKGPRKERFLKDPKSLLDAWARDIESSPKSDVRRYFVSASKVADLSLKIGRTFEEHQVSYAITDTAAAQIYAPYLTSVSQIKCRILPGNRADEAIAALPARQVSEGANLAIIDVKSSGDMLFREKINGAWIASPIHVYLDLLTGEGRAKEAAEHLRRERIGF